MVLIMLVFSLHVLPVIVVLFFGPAESWSQGINCFSVQDLPVLLGKKTNKKTQHGTNPAPTPANALFFGYKKDKFNDLKIFLKVNRQPWCGS